MIRIRFTNNIMRILTILILVLFSLSIVVHAQNDKSNKRINKRLTKQPLEFDLRVEYLKSEDGRVLVEFVIEMDNKEIAFKQDDENYEAKLKLYARTRNLKKTGNIIFEEEFSMVATGKSGLKTARSNKTIYRKIVSFSAGTYKVQVLFWDINTKRRGIEAKGFTVPSILKTRTETN